MAKSTSKYRSSVAQRYHGPWMAPEVLGALPQLGRGFQRNADPEREDMRLHLEKPEAQRRQESVTHEAQRKAQASAPSETPAEGEREQTEQGAGEQSSGERSEGRGSAMVGKDQPKPALRPPESIARAVDESAFKTAWLAEQRDAALASAKHTTPQTNHTQEYTQNDQPNHDEPSQ